jgi:hypothetical protein
MNNRRLELDDVKDRKKQRLERTRRRRCIRPNVALSHITKCPVYIKGYVSSYIYILQ